MKKNNKKGFTLVELVIVIAVIAVLAAVLIPVFGNVIENANESAAKQDASTLRTACTLAKESEESDIYGSFDAFCEAYDKAEEAKKNDIAKVADSKLTINGSTIKLKKDTTISIAKGEDNVWTMTYTTDKGWKVEITSSEIRVEKQK